MARCSENRYYIFCICGGKYHVKARKARSPRGNSSFRMPKGKKGKGLVMEIMEDNLLFAEA